MKKPVHQKRLYILALSFLLVSSVYLTIPIAKAQIVDTDWVNLIETHAQAVDANTTAEIAKPYFRNIIVAWGTNKTSLFFAE